MRQRLENCKYCSKKLEGTTRKEFCSTKCRVYYNREKKIKAEVKQEAKKWFKAKDETEIVSNKNNNYQNDLWKKKMGIK